MKATDTQFLKFLRRAEQFSVPIYQRMYSWGEQECQQLWNDILRAGREESIDSHFLGSIVYIEESQFQIAGHTPMLVIDGQQRLATIALLIEALQRSLGNEEPVSGFSSKELKEDYLLNTTKEGDRRYKLLLTQTDRMTLMALLDEKQLAENFSLRVKSNFDFFMKKLGALSGDFEAVCRGLSKLVIVDISLTRGADNPQLIFECMNSTGLDLSQADLIRNFVLMGLDSDKQEILYKHYWRPMEEAFGQEAYKSDFDHFMRYYLTVQNKNLPKISDVYSEFKILATKFIHNGDIEELLKDLHKFAKHYCAFALGKESKPKLREAFEDLHKLKANVTYPLLLELYDDYERGLVDLDEVLGIVKLVECYVFRRAVCGYPTNSLNKTFATFARNIDKDNYFESVEANFVLLKSYRQLPTNQEFIESLTTRNIYNFKRCAYLLGKIENHNKKEYVSVDDYTIEHIMPQNESLSQEWQNSLGHDWHRIHSEYLHTLGNLTLTGYNSEYSNKPFKVKQGMKDGFAESPLFLNRDVGDAEDWNETAIKDRAERLADKALDVWQYPILPMEKVKKYASEESDNELQYTLNDHPLLNEGGIWNNLFKEIRAEIINIDPCVSEEFRKYYIVYVAEQIFVSIEANSSGIKTLLYLPFVELQDSRGITKQIPATHNWGRAEAELLLSDPSEIPYVMSLIRQAFRHQMEED